MISFKDIGNFIYENRAIIIMIGLIILVYAFTIIFVEYFMSHREKKPKKKKRRK